MHFSSRSGLAAVGRCYGHRYTNVLARDGLTSAGATWLGYRFWLNVVNLILRALSCLGGPYRFIWIWNSGRTLLRLTLQARERGKWRCKKAVNDITPAFKYLEPSQILALNSRSVLAWTQKNRTCHLRAAMVGDFCFDGNEELDDTYNLIQVDISIVGIMPGWKCQVINFPVNESISNPYKAPR